MAEKYRIYTVEDDPLIATDVHQTLAGFGYEVVGSSDSGDHALENIPKIKPDLVLMDIKIKGDMDGITVAEKLGELASIPVVFLTGISDEAALQRAKLTLPYGYLIKPFDADELHSSIELSLYRAGQTRLETTGTPTAEEEREQQFEVGDGDVSEKARLLSQIEIFRQLPKAAIENLANAASVRSFDAGEFIYSQDDENTGGFIVLSGKISITKSSVAGKELIVSLLGAGDAFGLLYLVKGFNGCCSARAQIASRALWIPDTAFNAVFNRHPETWRGIAEFLAVRLSRSYSLASGLAHNRVEGRIIATILNLLPEFGRTSDRSANKANSRLFMTRKELADLTGTTPETAIRVTKNLEREGYLDLSRPGIIKIIDPNQLKSLTQE